MTAGEYSDKLYGSGKGNGCHAFTLNMDWSALPDGVYLVEGYVGDNDFPTPEPIPTETLTPNRKPLLPRPRTWFPWECSRQQVLPVRPARGLGTPPAPAQWPRPGHTIAVDPRVIPYGSKVMINGVVYTAEDRGGAVRGNHIDIFFNTHAETRQHGTQSAEVSIWFNRKKNNPAKPIKAFPGCSFRVIVFTFKQTLTLIALPQFRTMVEKSNICL